MRRFRISVALLTLVVAAGSAQAVDLLPGNLVLTSGIPFAGAPFAGGSILDSSSTSIIGMNALSEVRFTGTLNAVVYQEAGGTLDFFYQFVNDPISIDAVERISVTGFTGFTTDVGYVTGAGGIQVPTFADRGSDGAKVSFDFTPTPIGNGTIVPGEYNYWVYIRTDALYYSQGTASVIDGGVATVATFAPAVPEPASLLAMGVGFFGLLRSRKRAKKS